MLAIINYYNINMVDANGYIEYILAITHFSTNTINIIKLLLLDKTIDINMVNNDGNTALMLASLYVKIDIVKLLLLKQGIDINMVNNDGNNALILAKNADINKNNNKLLTLAIKQDKQEIIHLLNESKYCKKYIKYKNKYNLIKKN